MGLVIKATNEPSGYSIAGRLKQGASEVVSIGVPVGYLHPDITVIHSSLERPLANEVMVGVQVKGRVKDSRNNTSALAVSIKAHRFSRIGSYRFSLLARDTRGRAVDIVLDISVAAGDEYRPAALERPGRDILMKAASMSPAFINKGNSEGSIPVIVAVWRRIDNLELTISDLKKQTRKCRLVVWLNNPKFLPQIKKIAEKERSLHIVIYSSSNIGGFGRFYAAKKESSEVAVMLDDDQRLACSSIESLMSVHSPGSIVGQWSFRFFHPNNYWLKGKSPNGVVEVDYVGTGGMVVDTKVFRDDRLYEDIPEKYWFIEDLWLSWFAAEYHQYNVYSLDAGIYIVKDGKDQMSSLVDRKTEFYKYLTKKGAKWSRRMKRLEKYDALTK